MVHNNQFGNNGLILESPGDLHTDIYGLETCTAVFKCPMDNFSLVPAMFSFHPIFGYLNMERRRVSITPGFLVITGEYAGIPGGSTVPIYEISIGLADEPIVTHPKFTNYIGGTPSTPLNGAIFLDPDGEVTSDDSLGQFAYFSHTAGGIQNAFAGIDSYLAADQIVWREKYYSLARPVITQQVGYIMPPAGPVPSVSGPNWLFTGCTYEQRGNVYFVCNEWRNSGRRGWNQTIYTR